jgi:F420-dependent oxidoreductase-like protein
VLRRQIAEWPAVMAAVAAEPFAAVHVVSDARDVGRAVDHAVVLSSPTMLAAAAAPTSPRRDGLRFGLQIPQFTWPGGPAEIAARLRAIATRAEEVGFDSIWVMDHFRQIPMMGPSWNDMLESWTTLAYLAAATSTIGVGTLVTGITYRNVAHLAKIVATLDVLSGGRAMCGVGLGWFEDEHRAYGWEFPDRAARYALLEDALQLLPAMWGAGNKPFVGRVLNVPDTACYPRPLQAHIPILVGGSGERRTLALVARYADACNLFGEPDVVARKVHVLRTHCSDVGRDPAEVSVTHLSTVLVGEDAAHVRHLVEATRPRRTSAERHARAVNAGTVEQHLRRIDRYHEVGVDLVIVSLADLVDDAAVQRYGAVITRSRDRGAGG